MENKAVSTNFRWDQCSIFNDKSLLFDFLVNSLMPTNPYPTSPKEKKKTNRQLFSFQTLQKQSWGAKLCLFFDCLPIIPDSNKGKKKKMLLSRSLKMMWDFGFFSHALLVSWCDSGSVTSFPIFPISCFTTLPPKSPKTEYVIDSHGYVALESSILRWFLFSMLEHVRL